MFRVEYASAFPFFVLCVFFLINLLDYWFFALFEWLIYLCTCASAALVAVAACLFGPVFMYLFSQVCVFVEFS
jgi:hypothetical protein